MSKDLNTLYIHVRNRFLLGVSYSEIYSVMGNRYFFLMLLLMLGGCIHSDDTDESCESDCTTMKGNFVTVNNAPLKGVKLAIHYDPASLSLNGKSRTIQEAKSDIDGKYDMRFFLRNHEIGSEAEGFFRVTVDASNLDSEKYYVADHMQLGEAIYHIGVRDTIIEQSFYFPTKALIKVNLMNFSPTQEGDRFEVRTLFPYGLKIGDNDYLNTEYQTGFSDFDAYLARSAKQTFNEVVVAENEENVIQIIKVKNGVAELEETRVFVPKDNTIELTYEY